jgi:hypothetical protein
MTVDRRDHLGTLTATSWDLRATLEAQLRALTALQRCIEDFKHTADAEARQEIDKHLAVIEGLTDSVRDTAAMGREQVATLQVTST